jgi:tRNA modification GTPase
MLTSKRQKRAVSLALKHAKRASTLLNEKNSLELVVEDLNFCINELDKITSKTTKDDVLDAVFSSFCVGK